MVLSGLPELYRHPPFVPGQPHPIDASLLTEIIGISADAIICVNHDQRVTFFNEGAERIFGYTAAEIMGKPLEQLLPDRHRSAHAHHVQQFGHSPVNARRMGERRQIAGRRKNGEEFPAEAAIAKLQTGTDVVFSVVLRDVTEQRRLESAQRFLAETGEALASTLDLEETLEQVARLWIPKLADAAVVEIIHHGQRRSVLAAKGPKGSPQAIHLFDAKVTAEAALVPIDGFDARSGRASSLSVESALAALPDAIRQRIAPLKPRLAMAVSVARRDESFGHALLFRAGANAMTANDISLLEDLARRAAMALDSAKLHDEMLRAVRARDETVSVVSHDLRNPVAAVKMLSTALLTGGSQRALPPDVTEQLSVILDAAQQMDALIQDLLDFSRAEAGRFTVDARSVACAPLLRDALRMLAPIAEGKDVRLITDWTESLPDVYADPERIAQVLSNVVGNAISFTPAGGQVLVTAKAEGDLVLVSVHDDGPGVPSEHLELVFDRFWQSNRRNRGAGLGLPIAKAIIAAHGGSIWAEWNAHSGATFRFTLSTSDLSVHEHGH